MTPSFAALLGTALVLLAGLASAAGFGTDIKSTRCNLDTARGQLNNPCPSLYNAECDGNYCKCPVGKVEHGNLHQCVAGRDDDHDGVNDDDDDPLGDPPFDYVPPGGRTTVSPRQPYGATPSDLTRTACTAGNDPCPSLHAATCSRGYCACDTGYKQDTARAVCVRDNSVFNRNSNNGYDDDDYDDGNNDRYGNRDDGYGNRNNNGYGNRNNDGNGNRNNDGYGNRNNDGYGNRDNDDGYGNTNNDGNGNRNNDGNGNRDNDDGYGNTNNDGYGNRDYNRWYNSSGVKTTGGVTSMVASVMVCALMVHL